jgi:hypothetical protein
MGQGICCKGVLPAAHEVQHLRRRQLQRSLVQARRTQKASSSGQKKWLQDTAVPCTGTDDMQHVS